ncbi:DNA-binding IclR family transcriptional regulator [Saccharopolyspora lacisalsi]|uniref:DNA-binding IclR family transcriptional regulator n=1 Tax=Halosaccharopolyspora lacisalsi TaxID=1000566 RepID=A0A839DYG5_9PSEU|nr:IclR family transcriptional regulator [Halosaccharopolyspora lacisalsi]MBA8825769.1 DNA-binding IclR family transcriptional regulator [Halosaccharopolyspora lacisalsi]
MERAFDILELFLDEHELNPPEITARLGLPRTTVHELVSTLVEREYLTPATRDSSRFRLGVRGFQLGSAYAERLDLAREGQLVAEGIAEKCHETVHIAVREGTEVLYVAKVDSTHPVRMVSAVGRRLPAHCTAVGKALLATLPRKRVDELYADTGLIAMTDNSITSRRALHGELEEIRAGDGVAREHCESNDAVACVAAPVRDHSGAVVAAVSISAPILRFDDDVEAFLRDLARQGADELSHRLGFLAS